MNELWSRPLYWEGDSLKAFLKFPPGVQRNFGADLRALQLGRMPPGAKRLRGIAPSVVQLSSDAGGDTFRTVTLLLVGESVHVLDAFKKKSKSGIATPVLDLRLIQERARLVARREATGARK